MSQAVAATVMAVTIRLLLPTLVMLLLLSCVGSSLSSSVMTIAGVRICGRILGDPVWLPAVEDVERDAVAAELLERAGDLGVRARPVGADRDHAELLHLGDDLGGLERDLLVDLAGDAPGGGEVDEHGTAGGAELGDARGRERLPGEGRRGVRAVRRDMRRRRVDRRDGEHEERRDGDGRRRDQTRGSAAEAPATQAANAISTSPMRMAPTACGPAWKLATQTSHTTVASNGKARSCFNVSIHAPGRGSRDARAGTKVTSTYGKASPRPRLVKTASAIAAGCPSA